MTQHNRTPATCGRGERRWARPVMALVALLAAILAVSCGAAAGSGGGAEPAGNEPAPNDPGATGELGNPTLGAADAPVVMVEWGDFQ